MPALALARRVAVITVAILIATAGGAAGAYAVAQPQNGVERLWSKFPLGPRVQASRAHPTRHRASQPPPTSASAAPTGEDAAKPNRSSRIPGWLSPLIVAVVLGLGAAAFWLSRRRRGTGRPVVRPVAQEQAAVTIGHRGTDVVPDALPPRSMRPPLGPARPTEPSVAPPQEAHPWTSGEPRSLETLPRRELFEIANALGIEDTILMSRQELLEALRPSRPPIAGTAAEASNLELARYAAAYAAACRSSNPDPILAVSAIAPPTAEDPARYSKEMVAEARRRGLLTGNGGGEPRGELTARSKILLRQWARDHRQ